MQFTLEQQRLTIDGHITSQNSQDLRHHINQVIDHQQNLAAITVKSSAQIDGVSLYYLHRLINYGHKRNAEIHISKPIVQQLKHYDFDHVQDQPMHCVEKNILVQLGLAVCNLPEMLRCALGFFGYFLSQCLQCLKGQQKFRRKALYNIIDAAGINALGIVGLVAFLLGIVLVYQGVNQLVRFGAQIYTINLLAISVMRELGVLMTAIIVAGRSGSSFTAELGFMKLNNEVDALTVMGINAFNLLALPRILGLIIVVPLLVIYSNMVALAGGGLLSTLLIDVSWGQYWQQLIMAVTPWTIWSGLIKAPFFGLIIGCISCYEGLSVSGGSEDVGRRTTRSVVRSIFVVITLDAIFSIIYAKMGI